MKAIIIYYSRGGVTKQMAEIIAETLDKHGVEAFLSSVDALTSRTLLEYDGIIVGSPTYYGSMAAQIKQLFDATVSFHGKLDGKTGGAFSSSANIGGGNETTVLAILQAMLIHGMIVQGDPQGDHYGPIAVGSVDERCRKNCQRFAQRFVNLMRR